MARRLEELSGPWKGFWTQERVRGYMRLHLQFREANLSGTGNDPIGSFEIVGILCDDGQRVMFTQQYRTHGVEYAGQWDGTMIYGKWTLHDEAFTEIGEFEIWPDRDESFQLSEVAAWEHGLVVPGGS